MKVSNLSPLQTLAKQQNPQAASNDLWLPATFTPYSNLEPLSPTQRAILEKFSAHQVAIELSVNMGQRGTRAKFIKLTIHCNNCTTTSIVDRNDYLARFIRSTPCTLS